MEDLRGMKQKLTLTLEEASELTARIDNLSHDKEASAAALAGLAQEQNRLIQQKADAEEKISKLEAQVIVPPSSHHTNALVPLNITGHALHRVSLLEPSAFQAGFAQAAAEIQIVLCLSGSTEPLYDSTASLLASVRTRSKHQIQHMAHCIQLAIGPPHRACNRCHNSS